MKRWIVAVLVCSNVVSLAFSLLAFVRANVVDRSEFDLPRCVSSVAAVRSVFGGSGAQSNATAFLNWYADNLSDLGDVIDIVVQSNAFFRHADLSVFSSQMPIRLQGIVSFWNKTDYQGTPVLTQELHVVYVRRIINPVSQSSSYAFYNIVPDTIPHTFSSINYGIGSTNSPFYTFYVSSQFIQGYTIAA